MHGAVIFDLDGTLIDSEENYRRADEEFLRRHGIALSEEEWSRAIGVGGWAFVEGLKATHGLTGDVEQLLIEKDEVYLAVARGRTAAFAPMVRFVELCRQRGLALAVASGSTRAMIDATLQDSGLCDHFPVTVSSNEVAVGKPAPDVFREAARRLGVAPDRCIVVEDSRYGVQAALAAGMPCIGVPTVRPPAAEFARCALSFSAGMDAFDPDVAIRLVEHVLR